MTLKVCVLNTNHKNIETGLSGFETTNNPADLSASEQASNNGCAAYGGFVAFAPLNTESSFHFACTRHLRHISPKNQVRFVRLGRFQAYFYLFTVGCQQHISLCNF